MIQSFNAYIDTYNSTNPEQFDELKADFRMGKFGKEVEAELVEILTK